MQNQDFLLPGDWPKGRTPASVASVRRAAPIVAATLPSAAGMRLGLLLVAATTAAAWAPAPARAPLVCRPPVPVNLLAMSAAGSGPVASARQGLVVAKDYVFAGGPVTPGSVARVLGYCWLAGAVPYVVISGASCGAAWADFMRANGVSPLAAGQYVPFLIGRQASANRAFRSMAQLRVLAAVLLVPAMRSAMRVVREACPLSDRPRLQSALATGVLIVVTVRVE